MQVICGCQIALRSDTSTDQGLSPHMFFYSAHALSLRTCHTVGCSSCIGRSWPAALKSCSKLLASPVPQPPPPCLSTTRQCVSTPFSIALPACLGLGLGLSLAHCFCPSLLRVAPPALPCPALPQIRSEYVGVLARTLSAHIKTYLSAMERMLVTVMTQADVLGAPEGAGSSGGAMLGGLFGKATAARATTVGGAGRGWALPRLQAPGESTHPACGCAA